MIEPWAAVLASGKIHGTARPPAGLTRSAESRARKSPCNALKRFKTGSEIGGACKRVGAGLLDRRPDARGAGVAALDGGAARRRLSCDGFANPLGRSLKTPRLPEFVLLCHRRARLAPLSTRPPAMRRRSGLAAAALAATATLAGPAAADPAAAVAPSAPSPANAQTQPQAAATDAVVWPALPAPSAVLDPRLRADAPAPSAAPGADKPFGVLSGDWQNANLIGDIGGLRPALAKYGITLSLYEEAETFGNLTGGVRQGFEVNGVTTAQVQLDTKPLFGLEGGIFSVAGFHIWGGDLSDSNLLNLQTVSGLEAERVHPALGALVSAEFRPPLRRQDRRTEPRQRVHHEPERRLFPELNDGLADAALGKSAGRRSRLPAIRPRRPRARPSVRRPDHHGGRFQRQPDPAEFPKHAAEQSQRRQLPAEHRRARDRRTAIYVSRGASIGQARRRRPAAGHVQDRRLVRQREFRRPASRHGRRPSGQPRKQWHAG